MQKRILKTPLAGVPLPSQVSHEEEAVLQVDQVPVPVPEQIVWALVPVIEKAKIKKELSLIPLDKTHSTSDLEFVFSVFIMFENNETLVDSAFWFQCQILSN